MSLSFLYYMIVLHKVSLYKNAAITRAKSKRQLGKERHGGR